MIEYMITNVARDHASLKNRIMRTVSRSVPRDILGLLATAEFTDTKVREENLLITTKKLNEILNPLGVRIVNVQNPSYRFDNDEYEKAIEDKKIYDQQTEEYAETIKAQTAKNKALIADALGAINKRKAKVDGEYDEAVLKSNAGYIKKQKKADSIKAIGFADAEGIKDQREAMATQGGKTQIQRKIVDALTKRGPNDPQLKVIVLPKSGNSDHRWTDMNRLLETYGRKSMADKAAQQK